MLRKFIKYEFSKGWSYIIVALATQLLLAILISNADLERNEEIITLLMRLFHYHIVVVVIVLYRSFSNKMFNNSAYLLFSVPISSSKFVLAKYIGAILKLILYSIVMGVYIYLFLLPTYDSISILQIGFILGPEATFLYSISIPIIAVSLGSLFLIIAGNLSMIFNLLYNGPVRVIVGFIFLVLTITLFYSYIYLVSRISNLLPGKEIIYALAGYSIPSLILISLPIYLLNNKLELS